MQTWKPRYEDHTMRCMGGYNVTNTPSRTCPNVGKGVSGKWLVLDSEGKVWQDVEFSTRQDAANAAYMLASRISGDAA